MLLTNVLRLVVAIAEPIVKKLEKQVKVWTKPTTNSLVGGTAADLVKSKAATGHRKCLAAPASDRSETTSGSSAVDSQRPQSAGAAGESSEGLEERLTDRET